MSHAPAEALSRRHLTVRRQLATLGLDALVVTSLPNVQYLTNFTGTAGVAVLSADRVVFVTDSRYVELVRAAQRSEWRCPGLELVVVDGTYDGTLTRLLPAMAGGRVGFEAAHLSVSRHQAWLGALAPNGPALVATERVIEAARTRKDPFEVEVLATAARRLSEVATDIVQDVRRGRTEREIALAIDNRIRAAGFERTAFDTIVAAGPNSALPHARPGERKLTEGDLVVLDFGGVYDSYCVDLTRTVSIGPAGSRAREVHRAVLDGHDRAIAAVAPGRSRFAIDAAARGALEEAGLGEAFGHGTGHGLGLEVHEDPRIVRRRADVDARDEALAAGMVFTIEPGAYLPGWGGVRIEDDVAVTSEGVEVLTNVPTELLEL
jgi:Xaa-Pro aminopeptidase